MFFGDPMRSERNTADPLARVSARRTLPAGFTRAVEAVTECRRQLRATVIFIARVTTTDLRRSTCGSKLKQILCGPLLDKDAIDWQLAIGNKIYGQGPGSVTFAGCNGSGPGCKGGVGYGNEVVVKYRYSGIGAWYGHLSKIDVHVGEPITSSTELGLSGDTGHSIGDNLQIHGPYAGHVHEGWGKPPNFDAGGGLPNDATNPVPQSPLYTHCQSNTDGPFVYKTLRAHELVEGWNCPIHPVD